MVFCFNYFFIITLLFLLISFYDNYFLFGYGGNTQGRYQAGYLSYGGTY
jgi:hypothetical protein